MGTEHIDKIAGLDLSILTYDDIRWQCGTGVSITRGTGRNKTYSYRQGVLTKLGDMEVSVWEKIAYHLVEANDDLYHLQCLSEMLRKHDYGGHYARATGKTELRRDALRHCVAQMHNNPQWASFMEYNQTYRPEHLKLVSLVTVVTECCNEPFEAPEAQTHRDRIYCAHCGRFSGYSILNH